MNKKHLLIVEIKTLLAQRGNGIDAIRQITSTYSRKSLRELVEIRRILQG